MRKPDKLSKADKKAIVGDFHKKNDKFWKKNDEKVGSPIKTREIKKIVEKPKDSVAFATESFKFGTLLRTTFAPVASNV